MKRSIAAGLLTLLAGCHHRAPPAAERVDPAHYDAFYIWAGAHPSLSASRAKLLYLLDGEILRGDARAFVPLRPQAPHLPHTPLWLVVRADRLDWSAASYQRLFAELERWQAAGNQVIGLQVDFDAATRGLRDYARFLADLRQRLPARWHLSVTGLMDWSAHGDPAALRHLAGITDEVVIQTYQGRSTIPGYGAYFERMRGFPIPFRVALVEHGLWSEPPGLRQQRSFAGYVVFLVPRPH